jgi:hypothetical protein
MKKASTIEYFALFMASLAKIAGAMQVNIALTETKHRYFDCSFDDLYFTTCGRDSITKL